MPTLVKRLRDAAMSCTKLQYAKKLRDVADILDMAVTNLYAMPTDLNMQELNAVWSVAHRALKELPSEADPQPPMAGSPEPARLAA